jgi:hypothetical protein
MSDSDKEKRDPRERDTGNASKPVNIPMDFDAAMKALLKAVGA